MRSQAYLHRPVTPSIGRQRKVDLRDLLASECCWNSKQAPRRGRPHCVSWMFCQWCYWLISSEEESRRRTWGNGRSQRDFRGEWKKPFKTEGDREQRACSAPVGELRPQRQHWLCVGQGNWMSGVGVGGIKGQLMPQTLALTWQTSEIPSTRERFPSMVGELTLCTAGGTLCFVTLLTHCRPLMLLLWCRHPGRNVNAARTWFDFAPSL